MSTDPRLEKVARAMALAERGYEEYPPSMAVGMGMRTGGEVIRTEDPMWMRYCPKAKLFLAAHDAIGE